MIWCRSWWAVISALWFVTACAAADSSPAKHVLDEWIMALNAGDPKQWEAFNAEHYPPGPSPSPGPGLALREMTGGLDLVTVNEATRTRVVAVLKQRAAEGAALQIALEVEATEPHRIVAIQMQPSRVPVSVPRLSEKQLVEAVTAEVNKRAQADRFSGVVFVAKADEPILATAVGEADRSKHVANTMETRFTIGSMNKMFTAISVLKLAQEGKLDLQAPLGRYLTDYPNKEFASKVTIHQLLTHTGGAGDIFGPEYFQRRMELRTHQDYVDLYGTRDPIYAPGSKWAYSNYGFLLLGALIEKVSGQSYYDFVRKNVYVPAGMTSTGSEPMDSAPSNLAVGYTKPPGSQSWEPNTSTLPYRGTSAGGGYSTASDLHRFANALRGHKLLNEHYTDLLTKGKVPALGGKYAYGMIEWFNHGVRTFGHGGNAPGMDADLVIVPHSGYIVVVLANMDAPAAQRVSEFIVNRLPER